MALREAAAAGKQIVASNCVSRPDGVLLFESGNASALADALRTVIDDPEVAVASDRLSDISTQYRQCYSSVLEKSR